MQGVITCPELMDRLQEMPLLVLDVRSPGEYAKGHIFEARNFALFSDEERKMVGTLYKQQGKEIAVATGLKLVAAKLPGMVDDLQKLPQKKVALYCWRGGMRSRSMAFLLETMGFQVFLLTGGHKSYRRTVDAAWKTPFTFQVLSGPTGVGKTRILQKLKSRGEQVLDFEAHAHHKGSVFGGVGECPPTQEFFTDELYFHWKNFQSEKPIWVEDEGRCLGGVNIPEALFQQIKSSAFLYLDAPLEVRKKNLIAEYAEYPIHELQKCVLKLERRLGGLVTKATMNALLAKDFEQVVDYLIPYYDKTYDYAFKKWGGTVVDHLMLSGNEEEDIIRVQAAYQKRCSLTKRQSSSSMEISS